jgi:amino acid adenylation domain-containing protein/non-ribosomal peptide synthase protein (TIGR01720 family)
MNTSEIFDDSDIAVIGMAGRFPGARDTHEFWRNLRDGVESVVRLGDEELRASGIGPEVLRDPNYVKAGGVLDDIESFDHSFFGFTLREAQITDPQHRLFLECAWEALEQAGYDAETFAGRIGVYAGARMSTYLMKLYEDRELIRTIGSYRILMGNDKDYLPTWTSYKLNLKGPSMAVQTACSTSLVAVHQACQSLLNGECDAALAGGASAFVPQKAGYFYQEGGINSPDGHCRAFDARAQGTVRGSGVGVVVLKRAADAQADGDFIHAIIKGSAINNDGSLKIGFTAPSVDGQAAVIAEAQALARTPPETITYVEAHGTGTALGDPIEIEALTKVFRASTEKKGFCAVGSVKTNIGHLDAAAGVAGLIKTVLALRHRQIPPSLHFERPNPRIDFESSPFYVSSKLSDWEAPGGIPRRAAVSSFGIGGTNAHLVLEEAPPRESSEESAPHQLLLLSAKTEAALERATANLSRHLKEHPEANLADVAYTLQVGRRSFEHRRMLVCRDAEDAVRALEAGDDRRVLTSTVRAAHRPVVFMFPGQGTQYVRMGLGLYRSEPAFREEVDRCAELLAPHLGFDLRGLLYPTDEEAAEAALKLNQTCVTQPALFVVEYALASLWMKRGVRPEAMVGHSIGEYVAACLSGVFSLEDALALVAARGRLIQKMQPGSMLAVRLSESELQPHLGAGRSLAAVNGPSSCVVSGPDAAIHELEEQLTARGVACRRLQTSHAFHSEMMEPLLAEFAEIVGRVERREPRIPYLSNLTGGWVTAEQVREVGYWTAHLRRAVRFADGVAELLKERERILLEVGPGQTLSMLVAQQAGKADSTVVVSTLGGARGQVSDEEFLLGTAGKLWLAGKRLDWPAFHQARRRRVPLPTYPFERKRCWIETANLTRPESAKAAVGNGNGNGTEHESSVKDAEVFMSQARVAASPLPARRDNVMSILKVAVKDLTGLDPAAVDTGATFYELGADSLLLIQVAHTIQEKFGLKISFRMLFDELSTLERLADYLDRELPPGAFEPEVPAAAPPPPPAPAPTVPAPVMTVAPAPVASNGGHGPAVVITPAPVAANVAPAPAGSMAAIVSQQLQLMSQQLEALRGRPAAEFAAPQPQPQQPALPSAPPPATSLEATAPPPPAENGNGQAKAGPEPFVPYRPREIRPSESLTARQQEYLRDFTARYNERTKKSKQLTQDYRQRHSEPRASLGFRLLWKEIIYPIVAERSEGSRIWDVDGNEYVDVAMGFGVNLFGHKPAFIMEALERQLARGIHIGPQSDIAGEVATLLCDLTGMERAAFTNSGTEAVMTALRVARTVTRRDKVALFAGSYHGTFDGTLAKARTTDGRRVTLPLSPGTTNSMVEDVLVLSYNDPDSLRVLRERGQELAAVLVEPVQSRRPDVQPKEFLQELRRVTEASGTALIFDEVVTGLRSHPGGAQALFDVRADIATYGKVLGGGMPIGAVTGSAAYMDAIDGGMWRYGDNSYPRAEQMFFAGTFCKHPLAMAAARAVLTHLREQGPSLQRGLTERTTRLADDLNDFFSREQLALRVGHFGSLLYFIPAQRMETLDLFYYHLNEKGVYNWEGHTCYLSTAHTDEDIEHILRAVKQSVSELRDGGFLPGPSTDPPNGDGPRRSEAHTPSNGNHAHAPSPVVSYTPAAAPATAKAADATLPLTEVQKQLWFLSQMGEGVGGAYHESVTLQLRGAFDVKAIEAAVNKLVERHEVLRTTFSPEGDYQRIRPFVRVEVPFVDFSHLGADRREAEVEEWVAEEVQKPFDLVEGPLMRVRAVRLADDYHYLVITTHHLITDGRSYGVLLKELSALYAAECRGVACELPRAMQFSEYAELQARWQEGADTAADEEYWRQQFADGFPILELPTDHPRTQQRSNKGARLRATIGEALTGDLKRLSGRQGCTMFTTLLGGFSLMLHQLSGQDDIVVGINVAQQLSTGTRDFVGFRINPLSIRSKASAEQTASDYFGALKATVLNAYEHQNVSVNKLNKGLKARRESGRMLLVSAAFNLDHSGAGDLKFHDLEAKAVSNHNGHSTLDIYLNVVEKRDRLLLDWDYNCELFEADTVRGWMRHFEELLTALCADPALALSALPRPALPAAKPAPDTEEDDSLSIYKGSNLTRYQMLIWAGQMLHPDTAMYINAGYSIIPVHIDRAHYQKAIDALVEKSDALRTVFEERDGVPQQRVLASQPYEVEYLDFSREPDPHAALHDWAQARCRVPLDLHGRVFEVALIKLADDEYGEYLNVHHIVTDAQSVAYIIRLIAEYYGRSLRGELDRAAPLPQFQDYVAAERAYLKSPRAARAAGYWRQKLSEEIEPLNFYGAPVSKRSTRVERVSCDLGAERTRAIKAYAAGADASAISPDVALHNVFAALIYAFLHRISGSRRISLGDPFHNRRGKDETIGLLMQILPVRVTIEDGDTFTSLISKAAREHFKSLQYSTYPVGNPVQRQAYDVEYNYITATNPTSFEGAPVKDRWLHPGSANESLAIQIHQNAPETFTCEFDFHRDVFDEARRASAVRHFLAVVDAFLEDASRPVRSVSLLSEEERRRLAEPGSTRVEFPTDRSFARLFEEQVAKTPERVAVSCAGRRLSYAELNEAADRLARRLRAKGVGPETLVAILARRGVNYLTAILAVFKAGGAYLPLDAQHPAERLGQVLGKSKSPLVLLEGEFEEALSQAFGKMGTAARPHAMRLDEQARGDEAEGVLPNEHSPSSLAYVIYTSGSTGVPKGAMVEQAGMLNHLHVKVRDLQLTADDVVAQTASQCFDISVWQFLAALLVGARVHVAGDEIAHSPERLWREIESESVTVVETVPSMLRTMLEEAEAAGQGGPRPDTLRWMLATGEALPPVLCRRWLARYPSVPVVNAYGPTECSDDVTHHVIDREPSADAVNVPVGKPVGNIRIYVTDRGLEPLPDGMAGELCVGGIGVGRGYLYEPARTAEVFVPDPFSGEPGARMYRTGDLGRYLPDGNLEYLGRLDHQVKVRGFRIELGEIEAALSGVEGVRACVVDARGDGDGEKRLVAYVVAGGGRAPTVGEMRAALKERLPEYMVPSAFVTLGELPLTPNGKVDRKALPAPDTARPELEGSYVEARTQTERLLAEIWAQVLNREQVGVHDNFFDLGGDSILTIQIAAKANRAGLRVQPMQMFEHQTVSELAAVVGTAPAVEAEQGLITGPVPLTPIQHWFFEQEVPDRHHWNQAVLLEVRQAVDPAVLERSLGKLLEHHDALRMRYTREGDGWRQVNAGLGGEVPFTRLSFAHLPESEQRQAVETAAAEQQASLNLSDGPVIRVALFDLGAGNPARLLIAVHHLVMDGVSWRILLDDLQTIYRQLSGARAAEPAPKTTSFKEWSERLNDYAQGAELRREADYWAATAEARGLPLPVDFPGGENTRASARVFRTALDADETQALLQEVPQARQVQIQETLLAALARTFARWTNSDSLLVEVEGHGREDLFKEVDLSRTVGWFTTLFPVGLTLDVDADALEALMSVRDQWRAVPARGIGYGLLRYLSRDPEVARVLRAVPRAEVGFNYLGQFDQVISESSMFGPARESAGPTGSRRGLRPRLLDINGIVVSGQLRLEWTYSENLHRRSTVESLAEAYAEELRSLISRCLSSDEEVYATAGAGDFDWGEGEMEEIASAIRRSRGE